jgi:hypothetical protein
MSRAREYLARAADAQQRAEQSRFPEMRLQFLELAADWRALAERVSDHETAFVPREDPFIPKDVG